MLFLSDGWCFFLYPSRLGTWLSVMALMVKFTQITNLYLNSIWYYPKMCSLPQESLKFWQPLSRLIFLFIIILLMSSCIFRSGLFEHMKLFLSNADVILFIVNSVPLWDSFLPGLKMHKEGKRKIILCINQSSPL